MSAENKPILLIGSGGTLAPLWRPLAEVYDLVFFQQAGAQAAAGAGVGAQFIEAAITPDVRERADTAAANLTAQLVAQLPVIGRRMAADLPAEHPAAVNSALPTWFPGYAMRAFGWQAGYLEALENIAANRRIAGVLTHEDVGPDTRTVINWANAKGLPTLHLPHAACHLLPGVRDIHRETRARHVLASGDYMAAFYADAGVSAAQIHIVGVPAWDYLSGANLPNRAEARQVLGIENERVLMYGTTWGQTTSLRSRFEHEFRETEEAVFALARAAGAYLIVNLHPNETRENSAFYEQRLSEAGVEGLVTADHGVYCTRAADVVVKHGPSNFCVEAAMMGTPSAYIQTEGFDFSHPLPPRGHADQLPALVDAALDLPADNWQDFIRTYNAAWLDGGAADAAVGAVVELCR